MRKALNYSIAVGPEGSSPVECDNFTCFHCQKIVEVPPGASAFTIGGGCRICNQLICSRCVDKGICVPWIKQMEEMERVFESNRMASLLIGR